MAKLTKIVNGEYIGGNKYKITSTGDGKSTIDFSPDTVLTPGTPVGAEVLNEIQKNGLYTLIGTKRVVGQEDIYDCTFEGIENFDFEEINILLKPNANSTMQNVFVNAGGSKYKITSILGTSCNIFANQNIGLTLKKSTLQAIKWDMSDDTKLPKGSLPTTIKSGKDLYDMLENNGGINIDTALLYLNDAGTKTAGKVYFDKNKKGLFECIKTTTNTVNSTEFFVDISNKASSDRLANLMKFNLIFNNDYLSIYENVIMYKILINKGIELSANEALNIASNLTLQISKDYHFSLPCADNATNGSWGNSDISIVITNELISLFNQFQNLKINRYTLNSSILLLKDKI